MIMKPAPNRFTSGEVYTTTENKTCCVFVEAFQTPEPLELFSFSNAVWTSCQIREIVSAHAPGMPGTFSPSPQVSDPDMHHGTCVTHVPWCMPGSLTSGFIWNRHSRRMRNLQFYVSGKRPMVPMNFRVIISGNDLSPFRHEAKHYHFDFD